MSLCLNLSDDLRGSVHLRGGFVYVVQVSIFRLLIAGNASQDRATESLGDFDATGSLIDASGLVHFCSATVISAMAGQIIGDPHQHAPQPTIGLADDWSPVIVRLVALMTGREQARTTGDTFALA